MYPDFHTHSSLVMSSRPQYFVLKEDEKDDGGGGGGGGDGENESKSKISSKDTSRNSDGLEEVAPKNSSSIPENPFEEKKDFDADDDDHRHDKEDKYGETSVSSTESEKPCPLSIGVSTAEVADDDEGFRTPTSPDHKIPVITHCPPAPKKTRQKSNPSTMKRKASPTTTRRALHLDLSSEVESMFAPPIQDGDVDSKIKKARRDHDHDSSE